MPAASPCSSPPCLTRRVTCAERIHTTAAAHLGAGPAIRRIDLETEAVVPGIEDAEFQELAAQAKANCPISKALAAVPEITMKARLLG